jgi:predicted DNA-binding protein (MmcQ/YjbR family)
VATKAKAAATLATKLRAVCAALPGATQDVKWGEVLVFSVGDKMFATTHTDGGDSFCFKVDDDRFLELTDRPGIVPAPYLARAKWVQITDMKALSHEEAAALVKRSYQLVFAKLTKKLQREIGHE